MTQLSKTNKQSWNHYWSLSQTEKFCRQSWSKQRIQNVLEPYLQKGGAILDAGCGSGFFSSIFCRRGLETHACDYAQEALTIAKRLTNGAAHYLQEDLLSPGLKQRTQLQVDYIFTDGLFEHFKQEQQNTIMENFVSVLKPGGYVMTFVPNLFSPWQLIRPFFMPGIYEKPFVLSALKQLHQQHALKIISTGGINTVPFRFSPDRILGSTFGMLLYCIAQKQELNV